MPIDRELMKEALLGIKQFAREMKGEGLKAKYAPKPPEQPAAAETAPEEKPGLSDEDLDLLERNAAHEG